MNQKIINNTNRVTRLAYRKDKAKSDTHVELRAKCDEGNNKCLMEFEATAIVTEGVLKKIRSNPFNNDMFANGELSVHPTNEAAA